MSLDRFNRRRSYVVLGVSLLGEFVLFGVRVSYSPSVYWCIVIGQLAVISGAAWKLGASAVRAETENRRRFAAAGGLLLMPWILTSFLAGYGPPWEATAAENKARYLILLLVAMAVSGGLVVLREALSEAGERFYSVLGFAATLIASPLYFIWAAILLYEFSTKAVAGSPPLPTGLVMLSAMSDILLFFGGMLTYVATAAFAASLGRVLWLGRRATRTFVTTGLMAAVCLAMRGLVFALPAHWYGMPGFIAGIPAIPWILPGLLGIVLLRRAGDVDKADASGEIRNK